VSVITTIRGYGDFLWVDVVEKIDAMASQVRQLPEDGLAASEMAAGGRRQAAGGRRQAAGGRRQAVLLVPAAVVAARCQHY
jgi:hypothetical protein